MDCKRFQELIASFVGNKIPQDEINDFLLHLDGCPECREELELSYSVMTALKQLDEGTDLSDNYVADLHAKVAESYINELNKRKTVARKKMILAVLLFIFLFMTGATFSRQQGKLTVKNVLELRGENVPEE